MVDNWVGIILAGGSGSRLAPVSQYLSKHLLPIYNKPMIYYPIDLLVSIGIKNILLISTKKDLPIYKNLLGNGSKFGINFTYKIQKKPEGIAQAFLIARDFILNKKTILILGDNIFIGKNIIFTLKKAKKFFDGSAIFLKKIQDPKRYGVIKYLNNKPIKIIEKPKKKISNDAVTGIYFYDETVLQRTRQLRPSKRGELEITDLNNLYLEDNMMSLYKFKSKAYWMDAGTFDSFLDTSIFVRRYLNKK